MWKPKQITRGKVRNDSEVNIDGWHSYNGLVDLSYEKHYSVHHGKNEFSRKNQHINWIERFRSFTKRRLRKFNRISKHKFALYPRESEFRFNCWLQQSDLYIQLVSILKNYFCFLG